MKKEELEKECDQRNLFHSISFKKKPNKQDYLDALVSHMKGVTRVPGLLFNCITITMALSCLRFYEVFATEPLHDLKNHIQNVFDELPTILKGKSKDIFLKAKSETIDRKDVKRGCDYRQALIMITYMMRGKCSDVVYDLLLSLCQISKIAYQRAGRRTEKVVLRLYNLCYKHGVLCTEIFKTTRILTNRKIFGIYFHALVTHFAETFRLIPLSSVHVESEERYFGAINSISKRTSDRKAPHIISNSILRLQAQKQQRKPNIREEESIVSKAAHLLPEEENTVFDSTWIRRPDFVYHLQRIPDYVKPGENVWWHLEGTSIVFKDGHNEADSQDPGPKLMNFYDYTFPEMQRHLRNIWLDCLGSLDTLKIPIDKIKQYDQSGNLVSLHQFKPWFQDNEVYYTSEDEQVSNTPDLQETTEPHVEDIDFSNDHDEEERAELHATRTSEPQLDNAICQTSDSGYDSLLADCSNVTTACTDAPLSTSLAMHVLKALPDETDLVRRFDALRLQSRMQGTTPEYLQAEAVIQQRVLKRKSLLNEKLRQWEIDFYEANKHDPIKEDYVSGGIWQSYNNLQHCKKLLKLWDITL